MSQLPAHIAFKNIGIDRIRGFFSHIFSGFYMLFIHVAFFSKKKRKIINFFFNRIGLKVFDQGS